MTTPASRVTELLPCPFCGGRGIPGTTLDNAGYVMCASETCWCMTGYLPTEAEAIAAWNTRPLSSDSVSDGSKGEYSFTITVSDDTVPEADYEREETVVIPDDLVRRIQADALDSGTGGQQPVAWRWRETPDYGWIVTAVLPPPDAGEVQPLYSYPEPKAGVVSDAEVKALAEAMFDYEPRNSAKRYAEASIDVQMRFLDKAAWTLKQARAALNGDKP